MITFEQEAEKIAGRLGWPQRDNLTAGLVAGMVAAGSKAAWNGYRLTQFVEGATSAEEIEVTTGMKIHIWNYPDESTGLEAIKLAVDANTAEAAQLRRVGGEAQSSVEDIVKAMCNGLCGGSMHWWEVTQVTQQNEGIEAHFNDPYPGAAESENKAVHAAMMTPQGEAAAAAHEGDVGTNPPAGTASNAQELGAAWDRMQTAIADISALLFAPKG